jgi:hypothetical protein
LVFTVRCYKCGESAVRLVLGGRAILHARCHACSSNLLAEVLEFEQEIERSSADSTGETAIEDPPTGEFDEDELFGELESA